MIRKITRFRGFTMKNNYNRLFCQQKKKKKISKYENQ